MCDFMLACVLLVSAPQAIVLSGVLLLQQVCRMAGLPLPEPSTTVAAAAMLLQGEVEATIDEAVAAEKWAEVAAEDPEYVI
jgi:hypothetical protein